MSTTRLVSWARCTALVLLVSLAAAVPASGQGPSSEEIAKDGRSYVFNIQANAERFEASGEIGQSITMPGSGPNGETVIGDNEKALQLFFFKHNIPMAIPDPPAPPP